MNKFKQFIQLLNNKNHIYFVAKCLADSKITVITVMDIMVITMVITIKTIKAIKASINKLNGVNKCHGHQCKVLNTKSSAVFQAIWFWMSPKVNMITTIWSSMNGTMVLTKDFISNHSEETSSVFSAPKLTKLLKFLKAANITEPESFVVNQTNKSINSGSWFLLTLWVSQTLSTSNLSVEKHSMLKVDNLKMKHMSSNGTTMEATTKFGLSNNVDLIWTRRNDWFIKYDFKAFFYWTINKIIYF